jgi:two-component system, NarL family, response regulator NreC
MKLKILMVDDHPSIIEGYKIILGYNDMGYELETTVAHNCKDAFDIITSTNEKDAFDLIFLDYSLPPYPEKNIKTGEDLGMLIRKYLPTSKIIILTSHTESLILYPIVKSVSPEGLLIKSDFTADELLKAFDSIMKGNTFYTATVHSCMKELLSNKLFLDHCNRQIISLLSQGVKTKSLPEHLNLSMSAIEKRKVQIRDYFFIKKGNDEDILREAKKMGFI